MTRTSNTEWQWTDDAATSGHRRHVSYLRHQYALSVNDADAEALRRYCAYPSELERWGVSTSDANAAVGRLCARARAIAPRVAEMALDACGPVRDDIASSWTPRQRAAADLVTMAFQWNAILGALADAEAARTRGDQDAAARALAAVSDSTRGYGAVPESTFQRRQRLAAEQGATTPPSDLGRP